MNLKKLREEKGLTLQKAAEKAHISLTMMYYIESGERTPSVDVAKHVAPIYGVHRTDFYEDNDNHEH